MIGKIIRWFKIGFFIFFLALFINFWASIFLVMIPIAIIGILIAVIILAAKN